MTSLEETNTSNNSNASRHRWIYWLALCACVVGIAFFALNSFNVPTPSLLSSFPLSPSSSSSPASSSDSSSVTESRTSSPAPATTTAAPTSAPPSLKLPATPLPEIDAYVAEINARKTQQPNLWSFPGKTEKYDMNKYHFKFDPQNPKCPEQSLKPEEGATNCPHEDTYLALWMLIRDQRRPENKGRPLTIVDVGSNKGYSVAGMVEALNLTTPPQPSDATDIHYVAPEYLPKKPASELTNFDVPGYFSAEALVLDVYAYAEKLNSLPGGQRISLCGACCDGAAKSPFHPGGELAKHPWLMHESVEGGRRRGNVYVPELESYLIDGTRSHVDYVKQYFDKENVRYEAEVVAKYNKDAQQLAPAPTKLSFQYYHRAMSNKKGTTKFCDVPFGMEHAAICGHGIDTPITTLDELIPAHVQKIDILLTDTEGHDFDVLEGARERWLRDGKVGIYVFETHAGPNNRPLSSIIGELEGYGYTCYIPVRSYSHITVSRHVVRVSPMELCWRGDYDSGLRGWKNMMCAHETNFPELKYVMEELSKIPKIAEVHCDVQKFIFQTHPWRDASWPLGRR